MIVGLLLGGVLFLVRPVDDGELPVGLTDDGVLPVPMPIGGTEDLNHLGQSTLGTPEDLGRSTVGVEDNGSEPDLVGNSETAEKRTAKKRTAKKQTADAEKLTASVDMLTPGRAREPKVNQDSGDQADVIPASASVTTADSPSSGSIDLHVSSPSSQSPGGLGPQVQTSLPPTPINGQLPHAEPAANVGSNPPPSHRDTAHTQTQPHAVGNLSTASLAPEWALRDLQKLL